MAAENGSGRKRPVSDGSLVPKKRTPRGGAGGLQKKPVEIERVDSLGVAAYQLRQAGKPLYEIAETLDMTENEVVLAINNRMKTERSLITSHEREGIINLEAARYDAIINAHWANAMMADDKSSQIVLKAMHQYEQLMQLNAVDPEASKSTVLVIGGQEQSYIQALKEASGQ